MGQKVLPLNITAPSSPLFLIRVPVLLQDGQFKCDLSPGGGRTEAKSARTLHSLASLPNVPRLQMVPRVPNL